MSGPSISNQGTYAWWSDSTISDAKIFLTADYVWGPEDSHSSEHRDRFTAYLFTSSSILDDRYYYLQDQFMTVSKYDPESSANVLISEKQQILARLRRVKLESEKRYGSSPKPKSP